MQSGLNQSSLALQGRTVALLFGSGRRVNQDFPSSRNQSQGWI